jgi:hypothetical protein
MVYNGIPQTFYQFDQFLKRINMEKKLKLVYPGIFENEFIQKFFL